MKRFTGTSLIYFVFASVMALGLFRAEISIAPYIAKHFLFSRMFEDVPVNATFVIAMFSLSSAIPTGVTLGLVLGLWGISRPGYTAFWLGGCAAILLASHRWFSLQFAEAVIERYQFYWIVMLVEALVFVGVLALFTVAASRIAVNVDTKVRKVSASIILLMFFGMMALSLNPLYSI